MRRVLAKWDASWAREQRMRYLRYVSPEGTVCYYDEKADECVWFLPPESGDESAAADVSSVLLLRKVERGYSKALSKRTNAVRAATTAYKQSLYVEAKRYFNTAVHYGMSDEDLHFKAVHSCLVAWERVPSDVSLEDCRQAFERMLYLVPAARTPQTLLELAKVYTHGGAYDLAAQLLFNIIESSDSSDELAKEAQLLAGAIFAHIGRWKEALCILDAACDDPPPGVHKDHVKRVCAWVEEQQGNVYACVGSAEGGLRMLQLRKFAESRKKEVEVHSPTEWYGLASQWEEAGDHYMQRTGGAKSYILGCICYREAVKRGIRTEKMYLKLHDCQHHLNMAEETLDWLAQAHIDNWLSMPIRRLLRGMSREWAVVFEEQDRAAVKIQALARRFLAVRLRQRLIMEREDERRRAEIHRRNMKWELRRVVGTYTDRKRRVFKRDFFYLWKRVIKPIRLEKRRAATTIQRVTRGVFARKLVAKLRAREQELVLLEARVQELANRRLKKLGLVCIRGAIRAIKRVPMVIKIQSVWRGHVARKQTARRRKAAEMVMKRAHRGTYAVFHAWKRWTAEARLHRSAIHLQTIMRAFLARRIIRRMRRIRKRMREVLVKVSGRGDMLVGFRKWCAWCVMHKKRQAVVRIQCAYRRYRSRQRTLFMRRFLMQMVIRAARRNRRVTRHVFAALRGHWLQKKRHRGALMIQCAVRCGLAKKRLRQLCRQREYKLCIRRECELRRARESKKTVLRAWRMIAKRSILEKRRAAVTIQRHFRGWVARRRIKHMIHWRKRRRRLDKRVATIIARVQCVNNNLRTRPCLKMWKHAYMLSCKAVMIQRRARGNFGRRVARGIQQQKDFMRDFISRCMGCYDHRVPVLLFQRWKDIVHVHRAAVTLQSASRGMIDRRLAKNLNHQQQLKYKALQALVRKYDTQVLMQHYTWWLLFAQWTKAATIIQRKFLSWRCYVRYQCVRMVARTTVAAVCSKATIMAAQKWKAATFITSSFRRERAYRRVQQLSYEKHVVTEERYAFMHGRAMHTARKQRLNAWQRAAARHRRRVVAIQSWIRTVFAKRLCTALRRKRDRVMSFASVIACRRRLAQMHMCFKAIESDLVMSALDKLTSRNEEPAAPEDDSDEGPQDSPPACDKRTHESIPLLEAKGLRGLDLLPYLADGKIPPDLFPRQFMSARHEIKEKGVFFWTRYESLTTREKMALLSITPTVMVEGGDLLALTSCLESIFMHHQTCKLAKLACFSTELGTENGFQELLSVLKRCTKLRHFWLVGESISSRHARALAAFFMLAPLEEIVLERNGLTNPGLAIILRALQTQQCIRRLSLSGNRLDHCVSGGEVGRLLATCASLKTLSLSSCHLDPRTLISIAQHAFHTDMNTRCRLSNLDLSSNEKLWAEPWAVASLLDAMVVHEAAVAAEPGFEPLTVLDLTGCGLNNAVVPALKRFIQERPCYERLRVVLNHNRLSDDAATTLVEAAEDLEVELVFSESKNLSFDFARKSLLSEGRTIRRHLSKIVLGDKLLARPHSPFSDPYRAPPFVWD